MPPSPPKYFQKSLCGLHDSTAWLTSYLCQVRSGPRWVQLQSVCGLHTLLLPLAVLGGAGGGGGGVEPFMVKNF